MNIEIKESQLEPALEAAKTNSSLYSWLMICLFLIGNTCIMTAFTATPFLFNEPKYLCQATGSNQFNTKCAKEFICSGLALFGSDYVIDKTEHIESFISFFDIFCSDRKLILLSSFYFIGGLLGIALLPLLITAIGCINSIMLGYFLFFFACCFLSFLPNYNVGVVMYGLVCVSFTFILVVVPHYVIEMTKPKLRGLFIAISFLSFSLSGWLSILIIYHLRSYTYLTAICGGIALIVGIVIKVTLVETIRTSFIQGNQEQLLKSLEYIAKINNSLREYKEWRESNVESNHNPSGNKNKYRMVTFISVWSYSSQVKVIIIFSLTSILWQFLALLMQYEAKTLTNLYRDLSIVFTADCFGVLLGLLAAEIPFLQRKYSFILAISLIAVSFLICGIVYSTHSIILHFILRLALFALLTINTVYNFEIYPTMIRPIGVSFNRFFSRFFNLGTPFLIISYPQICYYTGAAIALITSIILCVFPIDETRNAVISEYPPEYAEPIEGNKGGEDDEVLERINKESSHMS